MGFAYRALLTIDHTKCGGSDSTNFAFPVVGNAAFKSVANGGYVQNANFYDVGFYADAAFTIKLKWFLVPGSYDPTTGDVEVWVQKPTLTYATDGLVYVGIGDASITTDQSDTAAWDSNMKAVYLFGTAASLSLSDATANARTLTNNGSLGAAAGKVGGGTAKFNGTSQYLSNASVATTASMTVAFWVNQATADIPANSADYPSLVFFNGSAGTSRVQAHVPYYDKILYWDFGNTTVGQGRVTFDMTAYLDAWTHIGLVYDNTTGYHAIYVNGSLVASHTYSISHPGFTGLQIGRYDGSGDQHYIKSKLDVFSISDAGRSAAWMLQQYNSQNSPSTFYSLSSPSPVVASNPGFYSAWF